MGGRREKSKEGKKGGVVRKEGEREGRKKREGKEVRKERWK